MITKQQIQSCCGNYVYLLTLDKPIKKFQAVVLEEQGYQIPLNFKNAGVFYTSKPNSSLTISGAFGSTALTARGGTPQDLDEFIKILEQAIVKVA